MVPDRAPAEGWDNLSGTTYVARAQHRSRRSPAKTLQHRGDFADLRSDPCAPSALLGTPTPLPRAPWGLPERALLQGAVPDPRSKLRPRLAHLALSRHASHPCLTCVTCLHASL